MHDTIAHREAPFQTRFAKIVNPNVVTTSRSNHVAARFHSRVNHNFRAINGSANIKVSGLKQIYLKYQTRASTARELLYLTIRFCSVKHDRSVKSMWHGLYAIIYNYTTISLSDFLSL